jgi:hypothetical protein
MRLRMRLLTIIVCMFLGIVSSASAQQKGQWVPGQVGLNAGAIPEPGFTYANLALNYSATQLNGSNGNPFSGVVGTYSFWLDENIFYFVPKHKFLGGYYMPYAVLSYATGSLVADIPALNLGTASGGAGFADIYVQPLNIGWHLKQVDFVAGYAFVAPTGRYAAGASNNVGSGYWGNNITSGTTVYLTKNKGTAADLTTDWEIHGKKSGSNVTRGQAFTIEWGLGQILPLKKDMSGLFQFGMVGYDQWQVSPNGGTLTVGGVIVPASSTPYYSVHAIGVQANLLFPGKGLTGFFKYFDEYRALSHPQGRTYAFGLSWTLRIPKPQPAPAKP